MTSDAVSTTGRARVLVAEDEALIRLDLVELLTAEGYDVVGEAGDGEQALAMARELGARPGRDGCQDAQDGRHLGRLGDLPSGSLRW